jgi:hypothetical protein
MGVVGRVFGLELYQRQKCLSIYIIWTNPLQDSCCKIAIALIVPIARRLRHG